MKDLILKCIAAVNPLLSRLRVQIGVVAVATPAEVSIEEGRFLGELDQRTDPARPIVEIGTLFGHSTTILTLFKDPEQPLIGVDNFSWNPLDLSPEVHEFATRKVLEQATAKYNVTVKNVDKQEFFDSYDGPPPALVFCDADHSTETTLADINWARSVGAEIVCGHDYGEDPRVSAAVDSLGGPKELVGRVFVV
ncbi:MAG: class I SAM-dependent methyltransferase [Thermoleophilaceae bacterium]|nr:class I SAM-dependent methyltransferase [Thermoleophilaceae bacterium]